MFFLPNRAIFDFLCLLSPNKVGTLQVQVNPRTNFQSIWVISGNFSKVRCCQTGQFRFFFCLHRSPSGTQRSSGSQGTKNLCANSSSVYEYFFLRNFFAKFQSISNRNFLLRYVKANFWSRFVVRFVARFLVKFCDSDLYSDFTFSKFFKRSFFANFQANFKHSFLPILPIFPT